MARTWSQRERRLAFAVAGLLIGFVLFRVWLLPTVNRYRLLSEYEAELSARYLRARTNLALQTRIESERDAYAREISRQGSDQVEQSFLLQEVEQLGRDLPIRIRSMRPLPPQEMGVYRRYAVSIEAEGKAPHILKLLYLVETSPKLLKVEQIQLTADSRNREHLLSRMLISRPAVGGDGPAARRQAKGGV